MRGRASVLPQQFSPAIVDVAVYKTAWECRCKERLERANETTRNYRVKRVLGLSLLLLASYTLNANAAVKMGKANPAPKSKPEQAALNALGEHLEVSYTVLSNLDDTFCKSYIQKGDCFSSRIQLRAKAQTIAATTSLYFSHIAPIRGFSSTSDIAIEHLNGDLHRLTFNKAVPPNTPVSVDVAAPFWHASRSDAMANYYLTLG